MTNSSFYSTVQTFPCPTGVRTVLLVCLFIASTRLAHADLVVTIDTGAVGTIHPEGFFAADFTDANDLELDGTTLTLDFQFTNPLRLDVPVGDSVLEFSSRVRLTHDGDSSHTPPIDGSNTLTLNGTGGTIEGTGTDLLISSGSSAGIFDFEWEYSLLTAPPYDDGDIISGLTFTAVLPDVVDTTLVTEGRVSFGFESDLNSLTLTAVPEPSSFLFISLLAASALGLRRCCRVGLNESIANFERSFH